MESRPPKTAEDLLREEAIEATFNPGLWEPETSLYRAQDMGETTDAPDMGESSPGMEISAIADASVRRKREFIGPLRVGHRQRKLQRQSQATPTCVSHKGSAPVLDEDSRWAESVQDASRQPTVSKPTRSIDQDVLGIEEASGMWTREERSEVMGLQRDILQIVAAIGCDLDKFSKEFVAKRTVSEIYSAPRVTKVAKMMPSLGIAPGFALDLTTTDEQGRPWDFDEDDRQEAAWKLIKEERPMLVIGSPMCTECSLLLNLSKDKRDPKVVAEKLKRAIRHLTFCCEIYRYQIAHGRYFLHEHPLTATSWAEAVVRNIMGMPGVDRVTCHQCQYGAQAESGDPILKPTRFMSNCPAILESLGQRCQGRKGDCSRRQGGRHAACMGRTARLAAIYPYKLCAAILRGFSRQLVKDGVMQSGCIGLHAVEEEQPVFVMTIGETSEAIDDSRKRHGGCSTVTRNDQHVLSMTTGIYKDDLTGTPLDTKLVRAAIQKELQYFEDKHVWELVPTENARKTTGKPPITVRWVHTNKGDDLVPNMRARLVAREIKHNGDEAIFAPTPPLETLRTVLSLAVTQLPGQEPRCQDPVSEDRIQISLVDISRAYFNAKIDQKNPTFVELPPEHPQAGRGLCGRLLRHMYGTRHAAQGWQD